MSPNVSHLLPADTLHPPARLTPHLHPQNASGSCHDSAERLQPSCRCAYMGHAQGGGAGRQLCIHTCTAAHMQTHCCLRMLLEHHRHRGRPGAQGRSTDQERVGPCGYFEQMLAWSCRGWQRLCQCQEVCLAQEVGHFFRCGPMFPCMYGNIVSLLAGHGGL